MDDFKRRLGLLLAAVGVLVLASATYGVSSIAADRIADVGTTSDDAAYLAIEEEGSVTVDETRPPGALALTLTNGFDSPLNDLTATVVAVSGGIDPGDLVVDAPESLDVGTSGEVGLFCATESGVSSSGPVSVTVDIEGSGDGVSITTSETIDGVDISCPTA